MPKICSMKDRIFELIDRLGVSPTEFADKTGISQATISGIKTGRTKPTLTIIEKIKQAYPSVNIENLIFGTSNDDITEIMEQPSLDFENSSSDDVASSDTDTTTEYKKNQNQENHNLIESKSKTVDYTVATNVTQRKVVKTILFYDDGTFEVYEPHTDNLVKGHF